MEAIEILKAIALLCQVAITSDGGGTYRYTTSSHTVQECHKYYAKCIHSPRARTSYEMADDLRKCMAKR